MIDTHVHFWKYHPVKDAWIDETMPEIRRDFLPEDAESLWKENGIDGIVAVQADQSERETEFLLELSKKHSKIKGIIGWIDLRNEAIEKRLEKFLEEKSIKGWRHIVQAEPDGFLENPLFIKNVEALGKYGYVYEILIYHHQLPQATAFVEKLPEQPFVLDHLGKPDLKTSDKKNWERELKKLAAFPNVCCKLSGLVTEARKGAWTKEILYEYLDSALTCFGSHRLMFGSDWPVVLLNSNYTEWCNLVKEYLSTLSPTEQLGILHQNAVNFYHLEL